MVRDTQSRVVAHHADSKGLKAYLDEVVHNMIETREEDQVKSSASDRKQLLRDFASGWKDVE